ncbi:DNA repair protein rhp54 [Hordeum vulgare]|nr:DNA repair protein rhp54 [Hordeum vulgare]
MPVAVEDEWANRFMQSIIFEGDATAASGAAAAGYDPEETQSKEGQGMFMLWTYDQAGMQAAFMQDQVALNLDDFPLDNVFPDDYGFKEEDELDINGGGGLFEDYLANQAVGVKPKHKSRRTEAYTEGRGQAPLHSKLWRHSRSNTKASPSTSLIVGGSSKMRRSSRRNMSPIMARGRKEAMEEVGEGEKPRPRGNTNSKKEDKRDAASIALIAAMEGMMTKKDSRRRSIGKTRKSK